MAHLNSPCRALVLLLQFLPLVACDESLASDPSGTDTIPESYDEKQWETTSSGLLITGANLQQLLADGASLVDARAADAFSREHLVGAVNLPWQAFVDGERSGQISDNDAELTSLLESAGISTDRPVVIYGDWSTGGPQSTWGEEGRVLWSLEYLGHPDARVLIGGLADAKADGFQTTTGVRSVQPASAVFLLQRDESIRATTDEVAAIVNESSTGTLLDTRETREFDGQTPYGESRGGHIPGATHLWWYDLFTSDGRLRPPADVVTLLPDESADSSELLIPYCTGGIRSGFVYLILRALGRNVANYDASMWAWSDDPQLPVE